MITFTWLLGLTLQRISRRYRSPPVNVATGTLAQQQKQQQQQQQQQQQPQTIRSASPPVVQSKPPPAAVESQSAPPPVLKSQPAPGSESSPPPVLDSPPESENQPAPPPQKAAPTAIPVAVREIKPVPVAPETQPSQTSSASVQLAPSASGGKMSEQWAQKQVESFSFNFDQADKDKNGSLSFGEVHDVLKTSGFKGSEQEAKFIFGHLDRDNDQKISKFEFTAAINNLPRISIKVFVLRKAFLALDKDGSGFLTKGEIIAATSRDCGLDIAAEKISDLLVYLVKEDEDQKVSFEEFLYVFGIEQIGNAMKKVFEALDTDKSGFLSRDEILVATKKDHELKLDGQKISDLLMAWVKDDDNKIDYNEFLAVWKDQKTRK